MKSAAKPIPQLINGKKDSLKEVLAGYYQLDGKP